MVGKKGEELPSKFELVRPCTVRCGLRSVPWVPKEIIHSKTPSINSKIVTPLQERKNFHLEMINLSPEGAFWYAQGNMCRRQTVPPKQESH